MSTLIMETFAEFFKYGEPATKLPELEVKMPVNALALAIAAVLYSLFNFPFKFRVCLFIRSSVLLFYIETTISSTRMVRFT
jgi:hypothetical protein